MARLYAEQDVKEKRQAELFLRDFQLAKKNVYRATLKPKEAKSRAD